MSVELIKVKEADDGMRLNRWFLKYYPNLTLGRLQKRCAPSRSRIDGKRAEASLKLAAGQEVRIPPLKEGEAAAEKSAELAPKEIDFIRSLVIFKDDNVIAINKPSGLAVQGGTNTHFHVDGLLDGLKFEKEETSQTGTPDRQRHQRHPAAGAQSQVCRASDRRFSHPPAAENLSGADCRLSAGRTGRN